MRKITNNETMYDELPALYYSSDKASVTAQNQFIILTSVNLSLMIGAAIVGSLAFSDTSAKTTLAITSAILLTVGIFVTVIMRITRLERVWYDGRAIAESTKTLAWKYMTGSDPYPVDSQSKADEIFISNLYSLLMERKTFAARLSDHYNREQQITDKMRMARNLGIDERKRIYLSKRIDEQRKWYSGKARVNLISANRLFMGTIASQALAIIFAFTIIIWQVSMIRLTGVFTTLATAFMTWTQMRRNEELAQSYGLAAQELNFIYEQSTQVVTEKELSTYVINSENAISREHTMWLARKN